MQGSSLTQLISYAAWQPALTLMQTAVQLFNSNSSRKKNLSADAAPPPPPSLPSVLFSASLSLSLFLSGPGRLVINLFNNNLPNQSLQRKPKKNEGGGINNNVKMTAIKNQTAESSPPPPPPPSCTSKSCKCKKVSCRMLRCNNQCVVSVGVSLPRVTDIRAARGCNQD